MVAEMTFRKLNAPELLLSGTRGCEYQDAKKVKDPQQERETEELAVVTTFTHLLA
jgi:hypothetical protein